MGGFQVSGRGPGDDGYDEDGYDETQRAEILEATRDGPSDGTVILDLDPDLGGDIEEPEEDDQTDLQMRDDELGEEGDVESEGLDEDDQDEDAAQEDFDEDEVDEATLTDGEDIAIRP